jgi:hypothetical protein
VHYGAWLGEDKPLSWQEKLRQAINGILDSNPADMAAFIREMQAMGYEVKQGKYLSFKAPGQARFTRLRSLKGEYTDEALRERIEGKRSKPSETKPPEAAAPIPASQLNLLIDVQNSIKARSNPGYEQWAKIFNLKQAAQTLIYLQENNLTDYAKLEERTEAATTHFNNVTAQIKEKESRLNEIAALQKNISSYSRTREVYIAYRKSGYSKNFFAEHEGEIKIHQAAKKAFNDLGVKKLPSISSLKVEYATLLAEKKKLYQSYRQAKEEMKKLATVKANTDRLLHYSSDQRKQEQGELLR